MTHLGFFDIAMISNIPNIMYLAPASAEEYISMVDWAIDQTEHPVVIRTPGGEVIHSERPVDMNFNCYDVVEEGNEVAIIAAGQFLHTASEAATILKSKGLTPTVINPRILSALDTDTLDTLRDYRLVITMEDGIIDGGFGQKVAAYLGDAPVRVKCLGLRKEFLDRFNIAETLKANSLTAEQVAEIALK